MWCTLCAFNVYCFVERLNSLSPLSPIRAMNTVNSGGSSEKTSGFASMESSELRRKQIPSNIFHPNTSFSTQSSRSYQNSVSNSSNKSTLSSCGTPEDDFARQLLERSLPRPHSRYSIAFSTVYYILYTVCTVLLISPVFLLQYVLLNCIIVYHVLYATAYAIR